MLIKSYGLFWLADEITWHPGRGRRGEFRLLGRRGSNRPGLQLADFRGQSGIYILYGNYGPHYVGLTTRLGPRLRDHRADRHKEQWDRFSWFGFRNVLRGRDAAGLSTLANLATVSLADTQRELRDMEALLIRALGLLPNINATRFSGAKEWTQVRSLEAEEFLRRVDPKSRQRSNRT